MPRPTVAATASVTALALAACGSQTNGETTDTAVRVKPNPTSARTDERPRAVVENCSTRSQASFRDAFTDPHNVVVGPLVLVGAAYTPPSTVREFGGNKFPACSPAEPSGSTADDQAVTFWSGFVLTRSPRCIPVEIWVDDEPSPRRTRLRMGVRHCP
jgi:hypothetical protein